ncbi:MAG: hypothetical protein GF331_14915 [Chitinivibrionales bacterium]|nr:hypothetical protein [Chitinivibrionales bacterium]
MTIDRSAIRRILVIRFKPVGDVLLTTAYLQALRDAFPDARIDFCTFKPYDQILDHHPSIDNVVAFRPSTKPDFIFRWLPFLWGIRCTGYDLVIDQHNGTGSAQVAMASGARYRLGWDYGRFGFVKNVKAARGAERYEARANFDMLAPLGITEQPFSLFYHIAPESYEYVDRWFDEQGLDPRKTVCFSPGGKSPKRMWNTASYARLAHMVEERTDHRTVIIWAPFELECARKMHELAGGKPLLAPPTTLNQAAAFLRRITLLVCHNCGLMHLSVATQTPNLAIFGNSRVANWSPQGSAPNHWHLYDPSWEPNPENDFGITPERAFEDVQRILSELEQAEPVADSSAGTVSR